MQCNEFQSKCMVVRRKYRRGLITEHEAIKAFAQITSFIFGGYSSIYHELWLQDFEPCFED